MRYSEVLNRSKIDLTGINYIVCNAFLQKKNVAALKFAFLNQTHCEREATLTSFNLAKKIQCTRLE